MKRKKTRQQRILMREKENERRRINICVEFEAIRLSLFLQSYHSLYRDFFFHMIGASYIEEFLSLFF